MEVHTLEAAGRRMLLELLASERAGEPSLRVGDRSGRGATAEQLCRLHLMRWVDRAHVVFTDLGRHLAEGLADRLLGPAPAPC
jgi:hypothetical protein